MQRIELNAYQRNYLRASLRSFENALRQVELILDGEDEQGILYIQKSKLDIETRQKAREKVSTALNELEKYVRELGLETEEENPAQRIIALMSLSWENLSDIREKRLRNYGEIDPEVAAQITPPAERLAQLAIEISRLCGPGEKGEPNQ